jgi:UDPglucose 6-dehydrogenase
MRICVFGLWHLGCVTAACLASAGHDVIAIDEDAATVAGLREGRLPLVEPNLDSLTASAVAAGRLRFETDLRSARDAEVVWVTHDTPVDEKDVPQAQIVVDSVVRLFQHLSDSCLILISSQLPVGTTRKLVATAVPRKFTFGYSPENLRLGRAIEVFTKPDRVVVGLQSDFDRKKVMDLLDPFAANIIWMSIEAAEMTKHAINAFLATSIAFMNEVASICELVGADAKEVELGLKTEKRIGPEAYLSPGGAFAGGTLARDVTTLNDFAKRLHLPLALIPAIHDSNERHRDWALRKLQLVLGNMSGRRVSILGLTYKSGTSTLRRSSALELAMTLHKLGASVCAHDPAISSLPEEFAPVALAPDVRSALKGADACVVATPWPELRSFDWPPVLSSMANRLFVDAGGYLANYVSEQSTYAAVGKPLSRPVGAL